MNKLIKIILLFFLVSIFPALVGNSLYAGDYPFTDSSTFSIQQIDEEYFQSFRNDEEFVYSIDIRQVKQKGFWFRLARTIRKLVMDLGQLMKALPILIQIAMWGLVIFLIIVLISKTRLNRIFFSNKAINNPDFAIKHLNENLTDFDKAIQNEVSQKQYRRAIRLLYLKLINTLDKIELINYSKEKTNIDYLRELRDSELQPAFRGLTGIYNNVWYGQFEIDMQQYQQLENDFIKFLSQIDVKE